MGLTKKLAQWQAAGLISAEQAQSIARHEHGHKGGRFMKGLIGVALFAILCGVLSIVAANWIDIPAFAKIGVHTALNALVAFFLWRSDHLLKREGLCLLLFGLTLTLIALIGQVFQLGGSWANALMLWMVITAPLMVFFCETRITAVPWIVAFLATVCMTMIEYLEPVAEFWGTLFAAGIAIFLPLALIADGNIRFIQKRRPVWADMFVRTGFALLLLMASIASIAWYHDRNHLITLMAESVFIPKMQAYGALIAIFTAAFIAQGVYAAIRKFYAYDDDQRGGAYVAFLSLIFMVLPVAILDEFGAIASSLHLILFWVLIGWIGQERGWHRLVSWAIIMITIRIFIIYCELFGSLLMTGFGLIIGGIIMLALIWGARKLNKRLKVMA